MGGRASMLLALSSVLLGAALVMPPTITRLREGSQPAAAPAIFVPAPTTSASPSATPAPPARTLTARPVRLEVKGFASWALLDRRTGRISGSANLAATSPGGSLTKVWIVSDYLRLMAKENRTPSAARLAEARRTIRDSDDVAAHRLYRAAGGSAQTRRMISICRLTETEIYGARWSQVAMSARDAVRLAACVADGRAAGPKWTDWVRTEMTKVRGSAAARDQPSGGRWGIIDGLPKDLAQGVGIKNAWTRSSSEGTWRVNCLAVADDWALAVLLRYPLEKGLTRGAELCASVAKLLADPGPAA